MLIRIQRHSLQEVTICDTMELTKMQDLYLGTSWKKMKRRSAEALTVEGQKPDAVIPL